MPTVEKDFPRLDIKYRSTISGGIGSDRRAADVVMARRSGSVLDVGCGDGVLLRYLFEQGRVPLACLWACDLDPKRVRNARRQLYAAWVARNEERERWTDDDLEVMQCIHEHIFCFDILSDAQWPDAVRKAGINVVTLLGVSPAFDDEQMGRVASRISSLHPKVIVDVSAHDDFRGNFGGRIGVEAFFGRFGYRQTLVQWLPERFTLGSLSKMIRGRSYWPAAVLSAVERGD